MLGTPTRLRIFTFIAKHFWGVEFGLTLGRICPYCDLDPTDDSGGVYICGKTHSRPPKLYRVMACIG